MSKQVTAAELVEIVKKLLVDMNSAGELASREQYQNFMTDIAQAICDNCGGEIHHPADDLDGVWYIGIHGNDSLPENGGIWANYDKEGELFDHDEEQCGYACCKKAGINLVNNLGSEARLELERRYPRSDWQYEVQNGDTKLGYREWVEHSIERDDGVDNAAYASQVEQRDIFTEALQANFLSTSMTGRESIIIRRELVAQEILERYPSETLISRELYDADTVFGDCLNCMHDLFEFPNWEGRTVGVLLKNLGIPGDLEIMNVIQYHTRQPNKEGVCLDNITMQQLMDASPLGETGWMLPSGLELWFHQSRKD